jgi:hypothetical protein
MYLAILWCLQYVCWNFFSRNMVQWTWGAFSTFQTIFYRVPDSVWYQRWRHLLALVHVNCLETALESFLGSTRAHNVKQCPLQATKYMYSFIHTSVPNTIRLTTDCRKIVSKTSRPKHRTITPTSWIGQYLSTTWIGQKACGHWWSPLLSDTAGSSWSCWWIRQQPSHPNVSILLILISTQIINTFHPWL